MPLFSCSVCGDNGGWRAKSHKSGNRQVGEDGCRLGIGGLALCWVTAANPDALIPWEGATTFPPAISPAWVDNKPHGAEQQPRHLHSPPATNRQALPPAQKKSPPKSPCSVARIEISAEAIRSRPTAFPRRQIPPNPQAANRTIFCFPSKKSTHRQNVSRIRLELAPPHLRQGRPLLVCTTTTTLLSPELMDGWMGTARGGNEEQGQETWGKWKTTRGDADDGLSPAASAPTLPV